MSTVKVELELPEPMRIKAEAANLLTSEALVQLIAQELEAEAKWDELFAKSQGTLETWAKEALAEHKAGKTITVDRKDR